MRKTTLTVIVVCASALAVRAQNISSPGVSPGPGMRYATDAYPGFDCEDDVLNPEKKSPRWFAWLNGPNCDTPKEQLAYCEDLVGKGEESKAAKHFDALVRYWPDSPQAPKAQLRLAELRLKDLDSEEAFREYRYMLDFYALDCDYDALAEKLYKIATLMRDEGKTIIFFTFKNTVDVRHAFEAAVLRAPGAKWAPAALLTIADLREEEGRYIEAVKVYENLRNIHAGTPEAKKAVLLEARARMKILRKREYNRDRSQDTRDFLRQSMVTCEESAVEEIRGFLDEVTLLLEKEAYLAAKFYDSKMRTVRSAVNAYEKFLAEYPDGEFAPAVKARLEELKGVSK